MNPGLIMFTVELLFSVLLSIGMWILYAISFRKFTGMKKQLGAFVAISFTLLVLRPLLNNGSSRREKLRRSPSEN